MVCLTESQDQDVVEKMLVYFFQPRDNRYLKDFKKRRRTTNPNPNDNFNQAEVSAYQKDYDLINQYYNDGQ